MKIRLLLFVLPISLISLGASAEFTWNFTSDAEGWEMGDTGVGGWGMHGASLGWEANGADDGKLVVTYTGSYPASPTAQDFNPTIFRFYWNAPTDWDDSIPEVAGGATGKYCVARIKVNGTVPAVNEGEHWGKFETYLERYCTSGINSTYHFASLPMGEWTTVVYYVENATAVDPDERLTLSLGTLTRQSYKWFPSGGSTEIDWIKFVDDPSPYLAWSFASEKGVWQQNADYLYGFNGFQSSALVDGNFVCNYVDSSAGSFLPMITGESAFWAPQVDSHLYMRCRINCDPALESIQGLGVWTNSAAGVGFVFQTVPTNEWTLVDFPVPAASAGTVDSSWRIDLGGDYVAFDPIAGLLGGNIEIDYILMAAPGTDGDGDGLPTEWEIENSLDPTSATGVNGATGDPDGDGATNLAEFSADTDPQDPGSYPPPMPVGAAWALFAASAAILAYRRRKH